jgi:hypothetical protein
MKKATDPSAIEAHRLLKNIREKPAVHKKTWAKKGVVPRRIRQQQRQSRHNPLSHVQTNL